MVKRPSKGEAVHAAIRVRPWSGLTLPAQMFYFRSYLRGNVTRDFSAQYRKVGYFGIWAEESADIYGARDAVRIVAHAAGCCYDEDMRESRELIDALGYLRHRAAQEKGAIRFWKALAEPDPATRFRMADEAVKALQRSLSRAAGN